MLAYLAVCVVQFFLITSLMTGTMREIYSKYDFPYEGLGSCWALAIFSSLIPFAGLAGIFLGSVMGGTLAFSTKWKAD